MQVHRSDYIMCTWLTHSHKTGSRCSAWFLYSKEFRATTLPVSSDNKQYHVYWPSSMKNTSLLRVFWYLIFFLKKVFIKKIFIKKTQLLDWFQWLIFLKSFFAEYLLVIYQQKISDAMENKNLKQLNVSLLHRGVS